MHIMEATALLDAVEVQEADKEQERSVADRHHHKGDSMDVLHLPVELEVAFPAQSLMTPLHHSIREHGEGGGRNQLFG